MKPKEVSNIEQNALTICLEIKKRFNLLYFLYPKGKTYGIKFKLKRLTFVCFFLQNKVGNKEVRQMIGEIVRLYTVIKGNKSIGKIVPSVQNNQIKNHVTKDTAAINQISIIVSYTLNEKV